MARGWGCSQPIWQGRRERCFLLFHARSFGGLGASGMVMGALGLLAAQTLAFRKLGKVPMKHLISGVAAGFMLFVLFGLSPGTDTWRISGDSRPV